MKLELTRHALCTMMLCALLIVPAHAHGGRAGEIAITHPFATPTIAGVPNGAAYFVKLHNEGKQPDRLLRASTPAAQRAEIHTMNIDADGVMRMRELHDIALAPGGSVSMRPGAGVHIMLIGLVKPLVAGDSFPMTLEFERGGKTEVKVVVQIPKPRAGETRQHMH